MFLSLKCFFLWTNTKTYFVCQVWKKSNTILILQYFLCSNRTHTYKSPERLCGPFYLDSLCTHTPIICNGRHLLLRKKGLVALLGLIMWLIWLLCFSLSNEVTIGNHVVTQGKMIFRERMMIIRRVSSFLLNPSADARRPAHWITKELCLSFNTYNVMINHD